MSIKVCGSYCIELVFCSRPTSWIGDHFLYVTIKYWMIMKRLPMNWPVVMFLMIVMYPALTVNTSSWTSARSNPPVSWKTRRFSSFWRFSSSWAWQVSTIGTMSFPGRSWQKREYWWGGHNRLVRPLIRVSRVVRLQDWIGLSLRWNIFHCKGDLGSHRSGHPWF